MYFQIENTPEHIKRSRRKAIMKPDSPKEACPRLVLAPFSRPPQVAFENVLIGSTCEKQLEIFNPSKQIQQITLGKALPIGLLMHLPGDWLEVEPETCYCLTMSWTPVQPTALRETIRFTNESRGRFDVIVVLKSAMNEKRKSDQAKGFKISPGKMKKKQLKKSPVSIYKKKIEKITKIQSTQSISQFRFLQQSNKENICSYSIDSRSEKCPFDSPSSMDLKFDTSDVFPSRKKFNTESYSEIHSENTFDAAENTFSKMLQKQFLKPSNKENIDMTGTDIFDNLTFTPLKSQPTKNEKLEQGPKIILSLNSESDLDDSIENKNNENETHSIISITSSQPPNKWLTVNHHMQMESQYIVETPNVQSKKIPNTSSPKELHSPNFSINTEFSRISDLSFFPPRFSTERKVPAKFSNETHDLLDDMLLPKLHSDTYTKDFPYEPLDLRCNRGPVQPAEMKPPHYFTKDKVCRQSLFRENQQQMFDRLYMNPHENNVWQNHLRVDTTSPPRSMSPPLQTIPEENSHFGDTRTEKQMDTFTINRTFDRTFERASISKANRQSWSKKTIKAEQEIRKPPSSDKFLKPISLPVTKPKESIGRISTICSNTTFEQNRSILSMSQINNVYSQSLTVDPFSSTSYFYDEEAVDKFGKEFKRWLNCILTPPADLESNIEQKVDVGKAWIENRNKEVPAAPTKEQVCSAYHNSHRLESLRRAAKALLKTPEMTLVFQKLAAQIEKKLIAIRTDRNLHLDVGLQRVIMELLLAYNPLWLRIGLEAMYGIILPLKSNSDIEGLSTFIIQRLFKNPYLRNKHSKSNAPNMLLPAYMEAIKKYTLKKFFMLIFFLDQAKQRKLIPHDPCLFCRNAICKESREIIIRFTRELIAGIGDITKHLRPIGYVVSHKQSYLDEYKYAVHNIAVDLRDGVRLTKVMEIILMKHGLLPMLRTPAISRLQKIHNVHVALNALKEANFVIEGDIKPVDIADGHREKTLSLLWQLIHVFRAPLFEKAANVIQIWWRKKYEIIVEKRIQEEQIRLKQTNAASIIQYWWRQIQYKRYMQWKVQEMTRAVIVLQKYFRMWSCKIRLSKLKSSVLKIEHWYKSAIEVREAKSILSKLKAEREQQRQRAAVVLQCAWKRYICMKKYGETVHKIILIQSVIRSYIIRKQYLQLQKSVRYIQQLYRGKLQMRNDMKRFTELKRSAIVIQNYFRMIKQYRFYRNVKKAVSIIEACYKAKIERRQQLERDKQLALQNATITIQNWFRLLRQTHKAKYEYQLLRSTVISIQKLYRAKLLTRRLRCNKAASKIQAWFKATKARNKCRANYLRTKEHIVCIQKTVRMYLLKKRYLALKSAAITLQTHYRSYVLAKIERQRFVQLKTTVIKLQALCRGNILRQNMKREKAAAITLQKYYRMWSCKIRFAKLKSSVLKIEQWYKSIITVREAKLTLLNLKVEREQKRQKAAVIIQSTWKRYICMKEFNKTVHKIILVQSVVRCHIIRKRYLQLQKSVNIIQKRYRAKLLMRNDMKNYAKMKNSAIVIQKNFRMIKQYRYYRDMKKAVTIIGERYKAILEIRRQRYLAMQKAAITIQNWLRLLKKTRKAKQEYAELRSTVISVQKLFRAKIIARNHRRNKAANKIQAWYKATKARNECRTNYLQTKQHVVCIQKTVRMYLLHKRYLAIKRATITIQTHYRAYVLAKIERQRFLQLKTSVIKIQAWYRATKERNECRTKYLQTIRLVVRIQKTVRMRLLHKKYLTMKRATITIQNHYRAYVQSKIERQRFLQLKYNVIKIQDWYRATKARNECRTKYLQTIRRIVCIQSTVRMYVLRKRYLAMKKAAITIQSQYRAYVLAKIERQRFLQLKYNVIKIQDWYRATKARNECRTKYLQTIRQIVCIQSTVRMYLLRKRYLAMKKAAITVQSQYRAYVLAKIERQRFLQFKNNVIKIQVWYRATKARNECRTKYLRTIRHVVCIQSTVRMYLLRKRYLAIKTATITIQAYYRSCVLAKVERQRFLQLKNTVIKLQALCRGYIVRNNIRKEKAAVVIQKTFKMYTVRSSFLEYKKRIIFIQKVWRMRQISQNVRKCFLQKKEIVIKIQALIRGHLVRKRIKAEKELMIKTREDQRQNWAAAKIQALFRGHKARVSASSDQRVADLRRRWREGGLQSTQESLKERHEGAIEIIKSTYDMLAVISAFKSLDFLTEVLPMTYNTTAVPFVRRVHLYMSAMNRSLPCIEVLKSAASLLVNLTRYNITGPKIYSRENIPLILKLMLRFSNSESQLFCILCTHLWLFSKYDAVTKDLSEFLHIPENHRILVNIKSSIDRSKRMSCNVKDKHASTMAKYNANQSFNSSVCKSNIKIVYPALLPDYGLTRSDKPRYFIDPQQAISCLFQTYKL